jgi:TPR repeat protein
MWNLGERLLDGDGIKQDLGEGESWLRKSADGQNCCAQRLLGERLLDGRGVRQDRQEGERLLRLSAHSGHRCGMRPLAERLLDGRGLKRDRAEGILWLREAAAAGFVRAMVSLGWRLAEGRALKQDLIEAESWLRKAAEVGDAEGMGLLGGLMITRDGSAENAQAEAWLRQAAARGDASATGTLGLHLLEGGRLAQDEAQGELWLRRAAGAGSLGAAASLGVHLYRRSLVHGVRPWPLKEVEGIFRAVWRVERSVGTNLAYMHRRKETSATKTPIDKLLARGLKDGSSFAIVNLALCHAAGFERPVDPESADRLFATLPRDEELKDVIAWWQDVHASGDAEGGYVLAMLARHGFVEASAQELSAWQDMARTAGWPFPTEAARQKKPRLGAKKPHPRAKKPRRDS